MRNTNTLSSISFAKGRNLLKRSLLVSIFALLPLFASAQDFAVGKTDNVNVTATAYDDCNSVFKLDLNVTNEYWFQFQITEDGTAIPVGDFTYEGDAANYKGETSYAIKHTSGSYNGPTTLYLNTRGGRPYTISSSAPTLDNYVVITGETTYNETDNITLKAKACPTGNYTYTWYENGIEISGETGASLSDYVPRAYNATYKVEVKDGGNTIATNTTKVTTYGSNKRFSIRNLYGVSVDRSVIKELAGFCNVVYMIKIYPSDNEPQFEILDKGVAIPTSKIKQNGTNYRASDNGSAWRNTDGRRGEPFTFYLDARANPYVISDKIDDYPFVSANIEQIKGSEEIRRGEQVSFEASVCKSGADGDATFQWYQSTNGGSSWNEIAGETESILSDQTPTADSTIYRVEIKVGSLSALSNEIKVKFRPADLDIDIRTYTGFFRTITSVEYEVSSYTEVFLTATPIEMSNVTYKIEERTFDEKNYKESSLQGEDGVWHFIPTESKVYRIKATGIDVAKGEEVSYTKKFIIRVVYTCDSNSLQSDTLWYDDFGHFNSSTEFVIADANGKVTTYEGTMSDINGNSFNIENYWAADVFGSVKDHKYAMLDPRVGNNSAGDCNGASYYRCWCPDKEGYRVEDEYYAILMNPNYSNCGQSDYWNGTDHTGNKNGGMLFVNCSADSKNKVIYERTLTINNDCKNVQLLFSAFINNAARKANTQPVNVRLDIYDESETLIHSVSSGDIEGRTSDRHNWSNLTFKFKASGKKYTFKLTNNNDGGANNPGNDILLDDVSITICYPSIQLISDDGTKRVSSIETCERDTIINLYAFNELGLEEYFDNPRFIFQYKKNGGNWTNLTDIISTDKQTLQLSRNDERFFGETYFRAIVGSNDEVIEKILNGEHPDINCMQVYAIDSSFYLNFDYSGPMGADIDTSECVGNEITIEGDAANKPEWEWVDAETGEVLVPRSSSAQNKKYTFVVESDIRKFFFIGYEKLGCPDTQHITVRKKEYVEFTVPENDLYISCGFENPVELKDMVPATSSYKWVINGVLDENQKGSTYKIAEDQSLNGEIEVTGSAEGYCDVTKKFKYEIFQKFDLDLTLDAVDNKLCFASSEDVKLTATYTPGSARPSTYSWYMDGNLIETNNTNSIKVNINENGKYNFKVVAIDDVCYKAEEGAPTDSELLLASKTVGLNFTPRDTVVCEGEPITFNVSVENALDQVEITWTGSDIEGGTTVHSTSDFKDALTLTPKKETQFTDKHSIVISVPDEVCPGGKVEKEISYSINNPISLSIIADDTYCLDNGGSIDLTAEVNTGIPTTYDWYQDGMFVKSETTNKVTLPIVNGKNTYKVVANDGICPNVSSADKNIEARNSIRLDLTPHDSVFCEGTTITFNAVISNSLDSINVPLTWVGDDIEGSIITNGKNSSVEKTPLKTNTVIEKRTISISTPDEVCQNGDIVTYSTTYEIHNNMSATLKAEDTHCLSNGSNINVVADVEIGNPTSYEWYADGVFVEKTTSNTMVLPIKDGQNEYKVNVIDGVCSPFMSATKIVEARNPIIITIEPSAPAICEGSSIEINATVKNVLDPNDVTLTWVGDDVDGSKTTTGIESSIKLTPAKKTVSTENRVISVSTPDNVCSAGGISSATTNYNIHNKMEMTIEADRTDDLFCLTSDEGNQITLRPIVVKGAPVNLDWYKDGELMMKTADLEGVLLNINNGSNKYTIVSHDGICEESTSEVKAIEARYPMSLSVTEDKARICEDGSVTFSVFVTNPLNDNTEVVWSGDDIAEGTTTVGNSNNLTVKTTKSEKAKVTAYAYAVAEDKVCNTTVSDTAQYDVYMKLDISLLSDADKNGHKRCMTRGTTSQDLILTVLVNRGDPDHFIWSDGFTGELDVTNSRVAKLVEGLNEYYVLATDGVCNTDASATQAKAENSVEVREPISLMMSVNNQHICINNGTTAKVVVNNTHYGSSTNLVWHATGFNDLVVNNAENGIHDNKYKFDAGQNIIELTGSDATSDVCPATKVSVPVYVQDSLRLFIRESTNSLCQREDTVQYVDLSVGVLTGIPNTIIWSTGEENNLDKTDNLAHIKVAPKEHTTYWAYGTDSICRNSNKVYTNEIRVTNRLDVELVPETLRVQMGEYLTMTAKTTNEEYTNFIWFLNDQEIDMTDDKKFNYQLMEAGDYIFSVAVLSENCPARLSGARKVSAADYTTIPNIITPHNGNKKNNLFMPGYMVEVYNRYQQLVYEGENGWDGTYRGKLAEPGTYYYRVFMRDGRIFKGSLEVAKF